VSPRSYVVEITGNEEKVKAFLALVRPLGVKELVRTGTVAILRGEKVMSAKVKESKGGKDGNDVL